MEKQLTVKEVAEITGLSVHTLRYYEKIGIINPVTRAENSHRLYTTEDLEWIRFFIRLRSTGMPVKEMAAYAQMIRSGDETVTKRRQLLETHRETILNQILELQDHLELIDKKIQYYREKEENRLHPVFGTKN